MKYKLTITGLFNGTKYPQVWKTIIGEEEDVLTLAYQHSLFPAVSSVVIRKGTAENYYICYVNGEISIDYRSRVNKKILIDSLDEFTSAYLEAALWSSSDDNDTPLDQHCISDLSEPCLRQAISDCKKFQSDNFPLISYNLPQAGHDFWLTRNRHGAGFWDGDWADTAGSLLTEDSHRFGEINLYIGDDGEIHSSTEYKIEEEESANVAQ